MEAHFIDRHVSTVLKDLLQNDDAGLIRLIRKRTPALSPSEVRESLKRADIRVDFPVVTVSSRSSAPSTEEGTAGSVEDIEGGGQDRRTIKISGVHVSDLIRTNLTDPPLKLEKEYKGSYLEAVIQQDGSIVFDGQSYGSLSTAAGMARKSVIGAPPDRKFPQTNGWVFWKYRDSETGRLEEVDALRQRYLNIKTNL